MCRKVISLIAALVGGVGLLLASGCGEPVPKLQSGDPAPDFETVDLTGAPVRFPADFAGEVVAVRFWADWCPFCKSEMRALEPVYQQLKGEGLRILAINVGQSRSTAAAFVHDLELSYGVALDEASQTARRFGVVGLPTTFFVDRSGHVRGKILGESDPATFEQMVTGLL
jgi:peroxiredoxin